jgi:hypothetical protein
VAGPPAVSALPTDSNVVPMPVVAHSRLAALAGALLLAAACSSSSTAPAAPAPGGAVDATVAAASGADGRLAGTPGAVSITQDPTDPQQSGPRDAVQIQAARIDGDTLRLTVQYGGGCRQHVFRLVAASVFLESLPVQSLLVLGHDAKGDPCRALVRPDLAFSLAPLAEAYRRSYRTQTGTIDVRLQGWTTALRYTF